MDSPTGCDAGLYANLARMRAKWKRPGRREMGTHNRQRASSVRCRGFYMGVPGFDGVRSSKVHGHGTATGPKQTTDKSFDQMAA